MKQARVTKTEPHNNTIVCRGRLISISKFKDNDETLDFSISYFIISETELIKIGDYRYHQINADGKIMDCVGVCKDPIAEIHGYKILAMPENFSPEQIAMIDEGILNNGDEVLIECEEGYQKTGDGNSDIDFIKLDKDNHVKLFPVKKDLPTMKTVGESDLSHMKDLFKALEKIEEGNYGSAKNLVTRYINTFPSDGCGYSRWDIEKKIFEFNKWRKDAGELGQDEPALIADWMEENL